MKIFQYYLASMILVHMEFGYHYVGVEQWHPCLKLS